MGRDWPSTCDSGGVMPRPCPPQGDLLDRYQNLLAGRVRPAGRNHRGTMGEIVSELPGGFVGGGRNGTGEIGTGQLERAMKSVPANDATPSSSPSATPGNARPHHAADGERRQITELFADVVGFTAFA